MKNAYKSIYITLSFLLVTFLVFFTVINIFVYGSVMQINIVILSLLIVFPLYNGFKQKIFLKKVAIFMSVYILVILIAMLLILPKYTFNEAKTILKEEENAEWELHLKRYTGDYNFLYKGQYLIETDQGQYKFNIHDASYDLLVDE